jgi:hypothetical protein
MGEDVRGYPIECRGSSSLVIPASKNTKRHGSDRFGAEVACLVYIRLCTVLRRMNETEDSGQGRSNQNTTRPSLAETVLILIRPLIMGCFRGSSRTREMYQNIRTKKRLLQAKFRWCLPSKRRAGYNSAMQTP